MDERWLDTHQPDASGPVRFSEWWRGWQTWRDDRAVARRPISDDLWRRTLRRYPFLQRKAAADNAKLRRLASLFLDRKEFIAIGSVRLRNDVVVAIAAQACLPILRLGLARYDGFVGIVVHADQVVAQREVMDEGGVVHHYAEALSGEAMVGGPITLSWRDVRTAGHSAAEGYNVVIHEFAHVLDMASGPPDGTPTLPAGLSPAHWQGTLHQEFDAFSRRVQAGEKTALDVYGAHSVDEFFAVASESFFVAPIKLLSEHVALYKLLAEFYQQDPATEAA